MLFFRKGVLSLETLTTTTNVPKPKMVGMVRLQHVSRGKILNISEIRVLDLDGINVASKAINPKIKVTVSPQYGDASVWGPHKLIDGNADTFASTSDAGTSFMQIDLGGYGFLFNQDPGVPDSVDPVCQVRCLDDLSKICGSGDGFGGAKSGRLWSVYSIKIPTTPPTLRSSNLSTKYDLDGGGHSAYLDRQNVECPPQSGLPQFHLSRNNNTYRYDYQCTGAPDFGKASASNTPAKDWGGGNSVYLDRHEIKCPADNVVSKMHLVRPTPNTIQYNYTCTPAPALSNCQNFATPFNEEGGGNTVYLDRHDVKCPANTMLTRSKVVRKGDGNFRYEYTCCGRWQ